MKIMDAFKMLVRTFGLKKTEYRDAHVVERLMKDVGTTINWSFGQ